MLARRAASRFNDYFWFPVVFFFKKKRRKRPRTKAGDTRAPLPLTRGYFTCRGRPCSFALQEHLGPAAATAFLGKRQ